MIRMRWYFAERRPAGALAAGLGLAGFALAGCASLPAFEELRLPRPENVGPAGYPDLMDIPARPAPLATAEERRQAVESLENARARTAQAGDALRREPVIVPEAPDLSGL